MLNYFVFFPEAEPGPLHCWLKFWWGKRKFIFFFSSISCFISVIGHNGILKLYGGEKHSPYIEKSLWVTTRKSTKLWLPSQFRAWRNRAITPLLLQMISDKISGKSGFLLSSDLPSFLSWLALKPRRDALLQKCFDCSFHPCNQDIYFKKFELICHD